MSRWWLLLLFCSILAIIVVMIVPIQHNTSVRTLQTGPFNGTWAGYDVVAASGYHATFVNASWKVPQVTCTQGRRISLLIWVGLGGMTFKTTHGKEESSLEQIGTRIDCFDGFPAYSSWYEFYPYQHDTMPLPDVVQRPGDIVTASISYSNLTREFTLDLVSSSTPVSQPFSFSWPDGSLASADWVVEAPGSNYTQPRFVMPDFGNITFWNCFAMVGNHADAITGFGSKPYSYLNELNYVCLDSTNLKAVPSQIVDSGESFSISWVQGGAC